MEICHTDQLNQDPDFFGANVGFRDLARGFTQSATDGGVIQGLLRQRLAQNAS
jgi:hypothetical protein